MESKLHAERGTRKGGDDSEKMTGDGVPHCEEKNLLAQILCRCDSSVDSGLKVGERCRCLPKQSPPTVMVAVVWGNKEW